MDALATAAPTTFGQPASDAEGLCAQLVKRLAELGLGEDVLLRASHALTSGEQSAVGFLSCLCREGVLSEMEYLASAAILMTLEVRTSIDVEEVDVAFTQAVPIGFVRLHKVLGLRRDDGMMTIATSQPTNLAVIDHVSACLKSPVRIELAPTNVLDEAANRAYAEQASDFDAVLGRIGDGAALGADVTLFEDGDLLDSGTRAPVIKLVNMLLFEAVKRTASDVHIQPLADRVQARFRIDGVLYDYLEVPFHLLDEVVSRIKVIGKMDIAEKRLAQDGRTTVTVGDRVIDLRISVIPTSHGERAVLRLLDKSVRLYALPDIGMPATDRVAFQSLIQRTHGIVLVTGPTGSGKSTTLYAALQYLNCKEKNILTLEDPIEYQLPGISQTQVSTKKGMTFATGLRAVLRQDPDIIMVGEIRDEETARMAVQSSLTGHLVFSTLHTNDAAGAVARLLDLGIEPYLVASSLLSSLAQRLIRVLCPHCCKPVPLSEADVSLLQIEPSVGGTMVREAVGCDACAMTGYRGRKGVFELLQVDERIRELIVHRAKASAIQKCATQAGMTTLRQDAIRKLLFGETSMEEVARVTQQDLGQGAEDPVEALEPV